MNGKRVAKKRVANMQTSDPPGGTRRVYFFDPNGHLFEVVF